MCFYTSSTLVFLNSRLKVCTNRTVHNINFVDCRTISLTSSTTSYTVCTEIASTYELELSAAHIFPFADLCSDSSTNVLTVKSCQSPDREPPFYSHYDGRLQTVSFKLTSNLFNDVCGEARDYVLACPYGYQSSLARL